MSNDKTLKTLIDYFNKYGEVKNANDFVNDERIVFGRGFVDRDQVPNKEKEQRDKEKQPKKPKVKKEKKKTEPEAEIKEIDERELNKLLEQIVYHG